MNQVRIIGGQWKRRQIHFEDLDGLRPTPDRVRETLFNWLMWDVAGSNVLDVCAGSGALGFEALSRGAAHCTLIEPQRVQATALRKNAEILHVTPTQMQILNQTAENALPKIKQLYNVVFLDPPYALNLWQKLAELIDPLLAPNAKIYVEANTPLDQLILPAHWQKTKQTRAGQIHAGLFEIAP